jgi:hypothetical protein
MIYLEFSKKCLSEKQYLCEIIFNEFLGLQYSLKISDIQDFKITFRNGRELIIEDHFFSKFRSGIDLERLSVPESVNWGSSDFFPEDKMPILFGDNKISVTEGMIFCCIDVFATIFFMLSRWEEIVNKTRDRHERFPAIQSLAYKNGFLYRPLVDEYVEVLWNMMKQLDSSLQRRKNAGSTIISCDVDAPFEPGVRSLFRLARSCSGDLVKRASPVRAIKRLINFALFRFGNYSFDLNYTFDWYLQILEAGKLKGVFYFIPDNSEPGNGLYELQNEEIKKLLLKIDSYGHEIGVHGSYQSFNDAEKICSQKKRLEDFLEKIGIDRKVEGNRQHYLRLDVSVTPDLLEKAGFKYDSSGGFADSPGFRFGTAKEFSMWSWATRKKLKLKQRPLICMECSVIAENYLALGYSLKARELMAGLKAKSLYYNGNFVLLWHNSSLQSKSEKEMFVEIINS